MGTYYLDIETTGLDEHTDRILTIQYQKLERGTGRPVNDLRILKEWEYNEREILEKFISETAVHSQNNFDFISVGMHLEFEHRFLYTKSKYYSLETIDIMKKPCIDIKNVLILMNRGEFKDSGLDSMTGKKQSGSHIPALYKEERYDMIEEYIRDETAEFLKFYGWLHYRMPKVWQEFRDEFMSKPSYDGQIR